VVRTNNTAIASLMVRKGDADCMICGAVGKFHRHLQEVDQLIGAREEVYSLSTLTALVIPAGTFFICDTHATSDPSTEELVEMTVMAASQVQAFGLQPRVALVNRSNFGTHDTASARQMRAAVRQLHRDYPDLEVDGEMHADVALSQSLRDMAYPGSRLTGAANLFIMPNVDAAHIAYNLLKALGGGVSIGPILVGARQPVHVVTESITVRGLVNMTALTVAQAQGVATSEAAATG
jgi:malate dehydrogenase (oxaloacetate-decarboxylating)(NADP+)